MDKENVEENTEKEASVPAPHAGHKIATPEVFILAQSFYLVLVCLVFILCFFTFSCLSLVLSCFVLSCLILSYLVLSCLVCVLTLIFSSGEEKEAKKHRAPTQISYAWTKVLSCLVLSCILDL